MKPKTPIFKFNKKSPKSKISEKKSNKINNDYSKIICQVFEKNKEESKNNYINNSKKIENIKNRINNIQITNKLSKNIIKIELNTKKNSKNNIKEESLTSSTKEKKLYHNILNSSNTKRNKNIFQSNSEKNMKKEIFMDDNIKKNNNKINNSNTKVTSLNKNIKINLNLNTVNDNFIFRKQKSYNHKREGNKSTEKKIIEEKNKNIDDIKEKTINMNYNINEIFGHKKGNEQIKQFYQSNNNNVHEIKNNNNISMNKTKMSNKKVIKNKNLNLNVNNSNSPDKIIIKINNVGKNKNLTKKINKNNTGMINTNDIEVKKLKLLKNKKKFMIHNNTDNSPNNQNRKSKIYSKKKYIINIKNNNNNSSKNSSNSKISFSSNQIANMKGVKVESINIDLNITNKKNYKLNASQKKSDIDNSLNEKNSLTLRETEIPKYSTKFHHIHQRMELSLNGPNESTDLNHSFKTAFSLTKKTRSLSKKREEKKKTNWFKLSDINDEEENAKKLNDILVNLSNQKDMGHDVRNTGQRSEPKKLIDKIRKAKKMHKS